MDAATGTVLGATVGAVAGVVGTMFAGWLGLRREREARVAQRAADAAKWQREQLLVALTRTTHALSLYTAKAISRGGDDVVRLQNDPEMQEANARAQESLLGLILMYPDRNAPDFARFCALVDKTMWQAVPPVGDVWPIRQMLLNLGKTSARCAD